MRKLKRVEYQSVRVFLALFFVLGCARVNLTSKEPIKLDVTMRLDIYQHVAEDVNAIEDMISSPQSEKTAVKDKTSWLALDIPEAFAQEEGYPASVQAAIEGRKSRRVELVSLESMGIVGEDARGFVQVRDAGRADSSVTALVSDENRDRGIIYDHVAQKNGTGSAETGKVFAKRIQNDAPAGTPIQAVDGSWLAK